MKLVHADLDSVFSFDKNGVIEWIIESPALFSKYVQELYAQYNGSEGNFILSDNGKELKLVKELELIINPFTLNINDKKILTKLYTELSNLAYMEEMYIQTREAMSNLQNYFMTLEQLSPYILETDMEIKVIDIFKAIGVKPAVSNGDFFERLIQYIKLSAQIMQKRLVVLVNIRSYITDLQLEQLIETAAYSEILLLLIENCQRDFSNQLFRYIIDVDGCEIFLDDC